jgi:hypothetical protein
MDDHVRFSGTKYEKGTNIECGNHYKCGAHRGKIVGWTPRPARLPWGGPPGFTRSEPACSRQMGRESAHDGSVQDVEGFGDTLPPPPLAAQDPWHPTCK